MRKVLSFVLVLTLVLSSFSMAFAATPGSASLSDIAGNANADAIQVAYDLGVVTGNPDGTFLPEKAVTRAEFAAMITRALAIPDSALAGYTSTTFKDTTGYGWAVPYLAFAQSKGIMLGDGAGNVMPGRTITVNEAMTMALRAIGYTANSSLLVGAWPSNYVSIAQNSDLYDDVATNTTVNKASAAQIIYNLLTVQKVAVNTDGTTDYLWKNRTAATEANLLNTNLGATEDEDVILGVSYSYSNSLINITGKIGAFGTAYKNKDNDLIAFTVDSTALTGKIENGKFKVGDTKYDFGNSLTTDTAVFANTDAYATAGALSATTISAVATAYNDGSTVTINADVSGKKLNDIYSVVAWKADDADQADAKVQDDIKDNELAGFDFDETDDGDIDMTSFQLIGVASLDKIAEDDVVYVYTDGDKIRKVAVGTETVEGTIEEINESGSKVTIGGKDYELPSVVTAPIIGDFDIDDEGLFYLDHAGKIFKFDGTSGATNTYGIVQGTDITTVNETLNSAKVRLYLSDDSEKTFTLGKKKAKIDWFTLTSGAPTASAVTAGKLIGYGLDSNGDIKALDLRTTSASVKLQSSKNIIVGGVSKDLLSNAVVFTYKNDPTAIDDYDTAKVSEVLKGVNMTSPASVIYNKDGKVAALFVDEANVDVKEDSVYGVFNVRGTKKSGDDTIYRFTGFIDGATFTKLTDDDSSADYDGRVRVFGVYKIKVDANDVITEVDDIENAVTAKTKTVDGVSGNILGANTSEQITALNSDRTVVTVGSGSYTIADDAVVYKYDPNGGDARYSVSKVSALRNGYTVSLYDTKGDDANGIASVVIYIEN